MVEQGIEKQLENFEQTQKANNNTHVPPHLLDFLSEKDVSGLWERNGVYTNILELYYDYLKRTENFKIENREKEFKTFYHILWFIVVSLMVIAILIIILGSISDDFAFTMIISLVTVFTSLIGTIIIIPTKMVEFLFNKEDEKNMGEIIKNIQDYDKHVRTYIDKRHSE